MCCMEAPEEMRADWFVVLKIVALVNEPDCITITFRSSKRLESQGYYCYSIYSNNISTFLDLNDDVHLHENATLKASQ